MVLCHAITFKTCELEIQNAFILKFISNSTSTCLFCQFQIHPVPRNRLQLVGVTSMLVASKYEEMYAPEVADFVYITDNAYTKQEIRNMENLILKTLDFSLGKPLCLHFLRRNSKAGQVRWMSTLNSFITIAFDPV